MSESNGKNQSDYQVVNDDCLRVLPELEREIDLTFLDPPFNQQKDYASCRDDLPENEYWEMMRQVCSQILKKTSDGGAIYFMQREKKTEQVLQVLRETGWTFQNLIIWKKMTSAVPGQMRYGKSFQIIAFATKGKRPRVFNRLRIDPPLLKNQKYERENGVFVTDVWDDIRELTSGYFAGDEALRTENGDRFHKQQAPIALLLRILLSSTKIGDSALDPFAGTGTTAVVARQIGRRSINIEANADNSAGIENRLAAQREADSIAKHLAKYEKTENLNDICGIYAMENFKGSSQKQTIKSLLF
ncbi:MAG TPA: site-specific DNA-methyltransferase [Pyrinomonadaceae bacterium]|jgi:DNA modification methylase